MLVTARTQPARIALAARPLVVPHLVARAYSSDPHLQAQAALVRSHTHEGLSFIQLDRPKAKNALSVQLVRELRDLVEEVRFDGCARLAVVSSLRADEGRATAHTGGPAP
jgi:methylglutaconyl-CoA hydratase